MSIDTLMDWGKCCCEPAIKVCYPSKKINFTLYRYSSWLYDFPPVLDENNFAVDFTSYDFILTVKKNENSKTAIKTLTVSDGIIINTTTIRIATLVDIDAGNYVYDLIGESPDAKIITYFTGKIKVKINIGSIQSNSGAILNESGGAILLE